MPQNVLHLSCKICENSSVLTLDAVQVSGGQRLSLALVSRDALVLGLLGTRHVARASALLQVVAAAGLPGQRCVFRWHWQGSGAGVVGWGRLTGYKQKNKVAAQKLGSDRGMVGLLLFFFGWSNIFWKKNFTCVQKDIFKPTYCHWTTNISPLCSPFNLLYFLTSI